MVLDVDDVEAADAGTTPSRARVRAEQPEAASHWPPETTTTAATASVALRPTRHVMGSPNRNTPSRMRITVFDAEYTEATCVSGERRMTWYQPAASDA